VVKRRSAIPVDFRAVFHVIQETHVAIGSSRHLPS
jgi:hypothetical protein